MFGQIAAVFHVAGQLRKQLRAGSCRLRSRLIGGALEVGEHRRVERILGAADATEPGAVTALQIFDNRPVVRHQRFHHRAGSLRPRLVLGLHAPDGVDSYPGCPGGEDVAPDDDGRNGCEAESETTPDPEPQPETIAPARHCRGRAGRSGGRNGIGRIRRRRVRDFLHET
jgi:hypothetical protein